MVPPGLAALAGSGPVRGPPPAAQRGTGTIRLTARRRGRRMRTTGGGEPATSEELDDPTAESR